MYRRALPLRESAAEVTEPENTVGKHDKGIAVMRDALRQRITPPEGPKRRIGF
jgi:hypothetical protein